MARQQEDKRSLKMKNRILKQTHDIKLRESLSTITKKLEEVKQSTQKLGDVIKETPQQSENIKSTLRNSQSQIPKLVSVSDELVKTFSKMNDGKNFFEVIRDAEGKFSWDGNEVIALGGNRVEINAEEYNSIPDVQRAFTDTRYNFSNIIMDDESVLTFDNILNSLNYDSSKDSNSKRTKLIKNDLRKRVNKIKNPPLALPTNDVQGEGVKIIIPSNIIDIYTRLEILLGLKVSGHTDTLTEASI